MAVRLTPGEQRRLREMVAHLAETVLETRRRMREERARAKEKENGRAKGKGGYLGRGFVEED